MIDFRFAHSTVGEEARSSTYEAARLPARPARDTDFGATDLVAVLARAAAAWRRWRHARTTARELSRLDDRLLADIGLRRGVIGQVAEDLAARHRDLRPKF